MVNINSENKHNILLYTVASFLDWKEQQNKNIRGNKVMYDVKGYSKYLYEYELFDYWFVNNNKLVTNYFENN